VSRFLTKLRATKISQEWWEIEKALAYESDVAGCILVVPARFMTDFSSVPRWPLTYLLTGNTAHEAAVIHDYLYVLGEYSRAQSDEIFREAAIVVGEPLWRANLMYAGIRIGGWVAWRRYRKAEKL
jgi:hypothetical protein